MSHLTVGQTPLRADETAAITLQVDGSLIRLPNALYAFPLRGGLIAVVYRRRVDILTKDGRRVARRVFPGGFRFVEISPSGNRILGLYMNSNGLSALSVLTFGYPWTDRIDEETTWERLEKPALSFWGDRYFVEHDGGVPVVVDAVTLEDLNSTEAYPTYVRGELLITMEGEKVVQWLGPKKWVTIGTLDTVPEEFGERVTIGLVEKEGLLFISRGYTNTEDISEQSFPYHLCPLSETPKAQGSRNQIAPPSASTRAGR